MNEKSLQFDDVLEEAGHHGRWDYLLFLVTSFCGVFFSMNNFAVAFLGLTPEHRCWSPQMEKLEAWGWGRHEIKDLMLPAVSGELGQCRVYVRNLTGHTNDTLLKLLLDQKYSEGAVMENCDWWEYDTSIVTSSLVTEWDLVCDKRALISTVQATYMGGVFLGSFIFGMISDRFGRKMTSLIGVLILSLSGVAASLVKSYVAFVAMRFLSAMGAAGTYVACFVLALEACRARYRAVFGVMFCIPFAVGYIVLTGLAYCIRDWRNLQLAIAVPSVIMMAYYWILPESPRWLLAQGKFHKALEVLKTMAKVNGAEMPPDEVMLAKLTKISQQEIKDFEEANGVLESLARMAAEVFSLLRTPQIRKRTMLSFFAWFVVALSYYGLALNGSNFTDNIYLYMLIGGLVEIPAYILIYPAISRFGRRACVSALFIGCGIAMFVILAVPETPTGATVVLALAMVGKLAITGVFCLLFLYTAELFPTVIRNNAIGASSMFSRIGSIISPYIVDIMGSYHWAVPSTVFGACAVAAGLLALFLPETLHKKLPETIAEIERKEEDQKPQHEPEAILHV